MRKSQVLLFGGVGVFFTFMMLLLPYLIIGMSRDGPKDTMFYVLPIAVMVILIVIIAVLYHKAEPDISLTPQNMTPPPIITDNSDGGPMTRGYCPECGKFIGMGMPPYCPWCGAKLSGRP